MYTFTVIYSHLISFADPYSHPGEGAAGKHTKGRSKAKTKKSKLHLPSKANSTWTEKLESHPNRGLHRLVENEPSSRTMQLFIHYLINCILYYSALTWTWSEIKIIRYEELVCLIKSIIQSPYLLSRTCVCCFWYNVVKCKKQATCIKLYFSAFSNQNTE